MKVLFKKGFYNQTSDVTLAPFFTFENGGDYRVSLYLTTETSGGATGSVAFGAFSDDEFRATITQVLLSAAASGASVHGEAMIHKP
jgi:hypothetical protein